MDKTPLSDAEIYEAKEEACRIGECNTAYHMIQLISEVERLKQIVEAGDNSLARITEQVAEADEYLPEPTGPYQTLGERTKLLKDQMEYAAESDGQRGQEVMRLRAALTSAAMSLETIHEQAGHDEWMKHMDQVRGYANSRATVAREALG